MFWNVIMKGWIDGCGFTDGWLKVAEEVPIPLESWLVFTMIASKTFELSVFHPETGTEICFKKADVIVLDDSSTYKEVLDFGEVDLDDAEIGAMSVDDGLFDSKVAALIDEPDVKSASL
ncbi:putative REM family protein [Helianthus debilis subsp. tardiflorus]